MTEAVQIAIITGITATIPVITGFILQNRQINRVTLDQNAKIDRTHELVRRATEGDAGDHE